MKKVIYIMLLVFLDLGISIAKPVIQQNNIRFQSTTSIPVQYERLNKERQKNIAAIWGLKVQEYQRYLELMQNTPSGKWYQKLNPAEVLGINARSQEERMHFAKIVVRNTRKRVSNELKFQHAYDQAQRILYPNQKPIKTRFQRPSNVQVGDKLLFFTKTNNLATDSIIKRLLHLMTHHPMLRLNIYLVGKNISDSDVRHWASRHHIPLSFVQIGRITLNHDKGRFKKLPQMNKQLPLLLLDRGGQFNKVQINSLW